MSTNKENIKTKELSKEVRHKVVEKHHSGEGYKKISKSLINPLSTVKSIMNKWKMYHTTQTRPRSGLRSILSSRASRKLVRVVTVNPTMSLKDDNDKALLSRWGSVFINQQYPIPLKKLASWTSGKKEAITEETSKSLYGVCEKGY